MLFAIAPAAVAQPVTVVVNSTSSAIDGNTASIPSLIITPGFDNAISLMEAIAAANNTPGPKKIAFSPALRGKSIPFGSNDLHDLGLFSLRSGDLTIDGDVDGDGSPDVTLDATGRDLATIHFRSSNIVITNLIFREFAGQALNFACEDPACAPRTISNVRIAHNVIESHRGGGVELGVWGLLGLGNAPLLSNFSYADITIDRNTIRGPVDPFSNAVGIRPCADGAYSNRAVGIFITNNVMTSTVAIDIGAADEALPPNFSDHCLIDNLVIDGNMIEDSQTGIKLDASNLANQHNTAQHLRITNNRVLRNKAFGMLLGAANLPLSARATSFNTMSDLLVANNEVTGGFVGITVSAGNWSLSEDAPTGVDDNTLSDTVVTGNFIHDYQNVGLAVWGGHANMSSGPHTASRNRVDGLLIAGNVFEGTAGRFNTGVEIVAGDSVGGRTAAGNSISGVTIAGNTLRSNQVGFSLIGGRGTAATGNVLSIIAVSPNVFDGNARDVATVVDAEGASNNRIEMISRRRPAIH